MIAAGVLLAACGSSGGGTATGGAPSTTTTTTNTTPAPSSTGGSTSASGTTSVGTAASTTIKITGGHLTDAAGRTIYLWVADTKGMSTCSGMCASVWPPVAGPATAGAGVTAGKLTTIRGTDGKSQAAYAGHPLYYFEADTSAGQTTGQGSNSFGAKWWEVDAAGTAITSSGAPAGGSSSASSSSASGGGGYGY